MSSCLPWVVTGLVLLAMACNAITSLTPVEESEKSVATEEASGDEPVVSMPLEDALAVQADDRRSEVLRLMGAPDAFALVFEELEGQVVRSEQWSYFDFESRFDFLDGELLWTVDLEPVPDGSIYAHYYDPRDFAAYMSVAEARDLLADEDLEVIELNEGDIPGGLVLVGDQIILGFDQDRLVYAETIILSPEQAP